MGKKAIPQGTRYQILAYAKLEFHKNKIAQLCNVSEKCVRTTLKNYDLNGKVDELARSGRPRTSTDREDRRLFSLARSEPTKSARSLSADWVRDGQIIASRATTNRRLVEMKLLSYQPVTKPLLTDAHKKRRLEWCLERQHWGYEKWSSIINSDEANYELINRKTKPTIRRFSHEKYEERFVQKRVQGGGGSIGVWGCINGTGTGCCHTYTGRLNAAEYIEVLENALKPSIELLTNDENFMFQQDNAPCHTANVVKAWFDENSIEVLSWPARSPDLSPIEHIWSYLDRKLCEKQPRTLAELEVALVELWNDVPASMCENLIESMPRRVKLCIQAKGGYFKY